MLIVIVDIVDIGIVYIAKYPCDNPLSSSKLQISYNYLTTRSKSNNYVSKCPEKYSAYENKTKNVCYRSKNRKHIRIKK